MLLIKHNHFVFRTKKLKILRVLAFSSEVLLFNSLVLGTNVSIHDVIHLLIGFQHAPGH